jgi:hypothetical protein
VRHTRKPYEPAAPRPVACAVCASTFTARGRATYCGDDCRAEGAPQAAPAPGRPRAPLVTAASLAQERDDLVRLVRLCTQNGNPDGARAAGAELAALVERATERGFTVSTFYGVQVVRTNPQPSPPRASRRPAPTQPRTPAADRERTWHRIDSLDEVWGITPLTSPYGSMKNLRRQQWL